MRIEGLEEAAFDSNLRFYAYPVDIAAAATATTPGTISIDADSDFIIIDMNFYNGGAAAGDLSIKIEDSGQSKGILKGFVKTDLISGDGKQPYHLPTPTRIAGQSSLSVEIKNSSGTLRNVQLVLLGYKAPVGYLTGQKTAAKPGPRIVQRKRI